MPHNVGTLENKLETSKMVSIYNFEIYRLQISRLPALILLSVILLRRWIGVCASKRSTMARNNSLHKFRLDNYS